MVQFILRRTLQSLLTIIIASMVLHQVIMIFLPEKFMRDRGGFGFGDPSHFEHGPWPIPYLQWLFDPNNITRVDENFQEVPKGIDFSIGNLRIRGSGALTGDFGGSEREGLTVGDTIGSRWGNTFWLVVAALIPTLLIALPLGVIAAARQNSKLDHAITLFSFGGLSLPPYWLGLMLVLFMAVIAKSLHDSGWTWLPYLPPGNVEAAGETGNVTSRLYHIVLPAATLAIGQIAAISRHVRFAMLEVLKKDYVRTAWAKGLPPRKVFFRHAFRNAMIPVITTVALALPTLVAGTIVVETVFGYSGMGQLFFQAMGGQFGRQILLPGSMDSPVVLVLMLMMVIIVVLSNLLADILYMIFNPRVGVSTR